MCRSRRELSNENLLAKIGVDTAENVPLEIWGKIKFNMHAPPYTGVDRTPSSLHVYAGMWAAHHMKNQNGESQKVEKRETHGVKNKFFLNGAFALTENTLAEKRKLKKENENSASKIAQCRRRSQL